MNDGFEGGALAFPRQGFDNASVPVGHLLLWPSLVTHPHLAAAVDDGRLYTFDGVPCPGFGKMKAAESLSLN